MKKTLSILSILCSIVAFAQQTPQSNTYIYNPFSINPAYAGASGCTEKLIFLTLISGLKLRVPH